MTAVCESVVCELKITDNPIRATWEYSLCHFPCPNNGASPAPFTFPSQRLSLSMCHSLQHHDRQLSFMHILPYDVTVLIFSFIPRYDCIQCLFVCRSWKDAVPVYTERLWHRLSLQGSKDYSRELSFLHKCFGVHVKHVSIVSSRQDGRLDILLRMLLAKGCTNIKSLGM